MLDILKHVRTTRSAECSDDQGFTIIEVIVAMMVFAVISVCVASAITNGLVLINNNRGREAATNIASQDVDRMRMLALGTGTGVFQITSTTTPTTTVVGGVPYSLMRSVNWVTTTGASGSCGTGSGTLAYKSVVDTVSWPVGGAGTQSIQMATLVAPTSNINSAANGTIVVAVIGASGAAESGLKITVTPNLGGGGAALAAQPAVTDSDGCSFALNVTPGSYTVTAATTAGPVGIDFGENAPASNPTVSVVAGQNSPVTFTYDQAAKYPLSYPSGAAVAPNMPVTFTNTSLPKGGSALFAGAPTLVTAFPYQNGYRVIAGTYIFATAGGAGTCMDTDPATWPVASTDGAVPDPNSAVVTPPGTTAPTTTAVPMGVVTISGLSGTVYLTAVSTTPLTGSEDPGCPATQTLNFAGSNSGSQTIALPFGTWSLYKGTSSGAVTTNLVATNPSGITLVTRGSMDSTTTKTVTLDPRVVPSP
jgi:prepilin-type N-terminal cleavage/methylation domain-containing protein